MKDSTSSHNIYYVPQAKDIPYPNGHQNCIVGSKVTVILLMLVEFAAVFFFVHISLRHVLSCWLLVHTELSTNSDH